LLTQLCETGALNKAISVRYSEEDERIQGIKNLLYDEESSSYGFKREERLAKPAHKSRSNLDRHFSRSKEKIR